MESSDHASRLHCTRCRLRIRINSSKLRLDRCPRCFAFGGVYVSAHPVQPEFGHLVVTTECDAEAVTLALFGALDAASKPCLDQAVGRALAVGCERVVIDLGALEFIDWLGLQLLLKARYDVKQSGHGLSLIRVPLNVQRLFDLTGATRLFSFED